MAVFLTGLIHAFFTLLANPALWAIRLSDLNLSFEGICTFLFFTPYIFFLTAFSGTGGFLSFVAISILFFYAMNADSVWGLVKRCGILMLVVVIATVYLSYQNTIIGY